MADRGVELLDLDFDRGSIAATRREVERHSAKAGLSDQALYRFVVAVHEIVTNAVRHGGGRGRIRLWCEDQRLLCRITDRGGGIPPERRTPTPRPAPGTIGGWGLWLAREGCDLLTVDTGTGGSVVTLIRRISGATSLSAAPAG